MKQKSIQLIAEEVSEFLSKAMNSSNEMDYFLKFVDNLEPIPLGESEDEVEDGEEHTITCAVPLYNAPSLDGPHFLSLSKNKVTLTAPKKPSSYKLSQEKYRKLISTIINQELNDFGVIRYANQFTPGEIPTGTRQVKAIIPVKYPDKECTLLLYKYEIFLVAYDAATCLKQLRKNSRHSKKTKRFS